KYINVTYSLVIYDLDEINEGSMDFRLHGYLRTHWMRRAHHHQLVHRQQPMHRPLVDPRRDLRTGQGHPNLRKVLPELLLLHQQRQETEFSGKVGTFSIFLFFV
ncbi:hypothetical protein CEXT_310741, partial [Caerostris extrusa]